MLITKYSPLTESQTKEAETLFEAAVKAEERGEHDLALQLFHHAAETDSSSPAPRFRIALLHFSQGKWHEAIAAAQLVAEQWPNTDVYPIVGRSYLELGHLGRAERAFRKSLAIKQEPWTWVFLSDVLSRSGRAEEAIECLRNAIKLDSNYEEAHFNIGYQFKLLGQNARAETHLRRAIELAPNYARAYAELGSILITRKSGIEEGVQLLKKSIRLDPAYGLSRLSLGERLLAAEEAQGRQLAGGGATGRHPR
jgi:tetratricopeptide (TPR) repeat protein